MKINEITQQSWYAWQGMSVDFMFGQPVQVISTDPLTVRAANLPPREDGQPPRIQCQPGDLAPAEQSAFLSAVWTHAKENYGHDGWDIFVECWSDNDLAEVIDGATDTKAAIDKAEVFAAMLENRRDDVAALADPAPGSATDATPGPDTVAMLVVTPDGEATEVHVPADDTLNGFYRHIGCKYVDVVRLDGVDMWVDDEGMLTGATYNVPATVLAQLLVAPGYAVQPGFMGTVVFTGEPDESGDTASLPTDKRDLIVLALAELRTRQDSADPQAANQQG